VAMPRSGPCMASRVTARVRPRPVVHDSCHHTLLLRSVPRPSTCQDRPLLCGREPYCPCKGHAKLSISLKNAANISAPPGCNSSTKKLNGVRAHCSAKATTAAACMHTASTASSTVARALTCMRRCKVCSIESDTVTHLASCMDKSRTCTDDAAACRWAIAVRKRLSWQRARMWTDAPSTRLSA
jgi:hypothetical protein